MKRQVIDMKGAELDSWVARAEGCKIHRAGGSTWAEKEGWLVGYIDGYGPAPWYQPSRFWLDGGPIIEREGISLQTSHHGEVEPAAATWYAKALRCSGYCEGPTPLIAAMRAYVMHRFGPEVDA